MANPTAPIEQVIEGFMPPGQAGTYHHFPFDMPPGTARLDVHYEYSAQIGSDPQLAGGNCVDIGIFDSRGIAFLDAGFRGWTGSARQEFFITPYEATPGYLPGPLTAGTWQIFLGFYKIAPAGCRYRVVIRCTPGHDERVAERPLRLPAFQRTGRRRADGWYRGELHCHTLHSDGSNTPREVVEAARALELDFLAITDHNTISALSELGRMQLDDLILIPGCEMTTFRGHWNAWGITDWVDFRGLAPEQMEQAMQWARSRGALVSCNHPKPFGPPWDNTTVEVYDCIEVWNGPWRVHNDAALAFWESQLRRGRRVTAVGGSDMHHLTAPGPTDVARLGQPTTWIFCPGEPSAAAILAALRAGHAFVSAGPAGPQLRLWADPDGTGTFGAMMGDLVPVPARAVLPVRTEIRGGCGTILELWSAFGCLQRVPIRDDSAIVELRVDTYATPYIRAQLVSDEDETQIMAVSNPIYLRVRGGRASDL